MNPFPRTSTPDEIRKAEEERKKKVPFKEFERVCKIAIYFSDDMDAVQVRDEINDMYTDYKAEGDYGSPLEFLTEFLKDFNRVGHSFWLDERGVMLLMMADFLNFTA